MKTETKHTAVRWKVDDCRNAQEHFTIRRDDGSIHGDTDDAPIATVYEESDADLIASAPSLALENARLREALAACDMAFAAWQLGQIPGRPEDILALIGKVRSALSGSKESPEPLAPVLAADMGRLLSDCAELLDDTSDDSEEMGFQTRADNAREIAKQARAALQGGGL